jgi:4'-phosphopantetheinyl transferase
MPLLQKINPAPGIHAGTWQITETAGELLSLIHLNNSETALYASFRHELRKKQWLAYRALLKQMLEPMPTNLSYDLNVKPFLDSGTHHISVSHAGDYAAVVYSEHAAVGIDIEKMKDRVERIKERFLQKDELDSLSPANRLEELYVFWGGKEALYKMHGKPGVDFRNDIHIHPFDYLCNTNQHCKATLSISGRAIDHTLFFQKIEDYMLVVAY